MEHILNRIHAVVIKDLCKGVISSGLINWLRSKFRESIWFVSSKSWSPDWADLLQGLDLRLVIIPQVSAQMAIREGAVSRWVTANGHPSQAAFYELDRVYEKFSRNNNWPIIVALPDEMVVIARGSVNDTDDVQGLVQPVVQFGPPPPGLPMASVFFASCIADLLTNEVCDLSTLVRNALTYTLDWRTCEAERVTSPDTWNPSNEACLSCCNPHPLYVGCAVIRQARVSEWKLMF